MAQTKDGAIKIAAKKVGVSVAKYRQLVSSGLKHCGGCRLWKSRDTDFNVDKTRYDGRASRCRLCTRVVIRRSRSGGPNSKQEQQAAVDAIRAAVKRGRLAKVTTLPCFDCGRPARHYHHHLGYEPSHRLDVVAVCISCHQRRHWG